jgi:hypothetical protein
MFYFENGLPYVAAINVAEYRNGGTHSLLGIEYSHGQANIAVPSEYFIEEIRELVNQ